MVGTDVYLNSYYNNIHRGIYVGTKFSYTCENEYVIYLFVIFLFLTECVLNVYVFQYRFSDIIIFSPISHNSEIIQNIVKTNISKHHLSWLDKTNSDSPYHHFSNISFNSYIFISRSLHSDLGVRRYRLNDEFNMYFSFCFSDIPKLKYIIFSPISHKSEIIQKYSQNKYFESSVIKSRWN